MRRRIMQQPAACVVGKKILDIGCRGREEHAGAERSGVRKSLAVPSEMFSHTPELLGTRLRLEFESMFKQDLEPVG